MSLPSAKSDRRFLILMVFSFVLGIVVALGIYVLWRFHVAAVQPVWVIMALVVCPPFILSYAIGTTQESVFALVLGVGTILVANGFLYAGVAAGIYAVLTVIGKRRV